MNTDILQWLNQTWMCLSAISSSRIALLPLHLPRRAKFMLLNDLLRPELRNPSINFTGTGSPSGKRIVPLLTRYGASSFSSAATRRSVEG